MVSLHFNFKDIFRSARLAFSLQRVWIQFVGLLVGYVIYWVLTYVSYLVTGLEFLTMWDRYGLLPCLFGIEAPWYSWIIYIVGLVLLVVAYLFSSAAVARATYLELKGETFFTWKEAYQVAFKNWKAIIFSPVTILGIILFLFVSGVIVGLLGQIPYVGELGIGFFSFFWMIACFFIFFLLLILGVSLLLVPAIVATTKEDVFEAVSESFSTATAQPWRLVLYEVLQGLVTGVGFLILAFAVKKGFFILRWILDLAMGDKFYELINNSLYFFQKAFVGVERVCSTACVEKYGPYVTWVKDYYGYDLPVVMNISAYLFTIWLVIIAGLVVSYGVSTLSAGQALIYIVLKKKKDDENLLERKEEEEEEEEEKIEEEEEKEEKAEKEKEEGEEESKPEEGE